MRTNLLKSINFIRCVSGANLNLFRYAAKSCDSQGVVTVSSYGASDEHPMSIRSAPDGTTRRTRLVPHTLIETLHETMQGFFSVSTGPLFCVKLYNGVYKMSFFLFFYR